jgi:STE20-like kinase
MLILIYVVIFPLQAVNKENGLLAAAKMCRLEGDEDLDDFRVEIDILAEVKHPNVVTLYDAFCMDSKLWVI